MQANAHGLAQMTEVIALQDHVVEFEERHRLFAIQAKLDRIKCQHTVYREMGANLLQQFNISQLSQPIMVVDHHSIGWAVTKCQKLFEGGTDRINVRFNRVIGEHFADFVLARRVANPRRSATHDNYWFVARLL